MQDAGVSVEEAGAYPVALVVAGSDSSSGAGIQADGKTLQSLGVYSLQVLTAVTAQNPERVLRVLGLGGGMVRAQLEAVLESYAPRVIKTGMLWDGETVGVLADFVRSRVPDLPLVVDPVMISTSGHPLLAPEAVSVCLRDLFPLARLITPNVPEAEWLSGRSIETFEQQDGVAVALARDWGCAVLLKGGHLSGEARDVLAVPDGVISEHRHARVDGVNTHGTGCTLASAIAGFLAHGLSLETAVQKGCRYVHEGLVHAGFWGRGFCQISHGDAAKEIFLSNEPDSGLIFSPAGAR